MSDLQKVDEIKCYNFSWEILGYDCGLPKIRSPNFTVNFQVTQWYIELDLSKLQNIDSVIPFRLQRVKGIGPNTITLDVKINVKLSENKNFSFEMAQIEKVFSENSENYWVFNIKIPRQKLESKEEKLTWLDSKNLLVNIEMKTPKKTDLVFPKKYWRSKPSLKSVVTSLKKLFEEGYSHDLVLKVSGEEFRLHKCILNARWPKLMSTLRITQSSDEVEIKEISGISPNIFKLLLQFAYYGDWEFMFHLKKIDQSIEIFDLVAKYNFYRLNDKITQLSPSCSSFHMLQSYRTEVKMKFTNVTAKNMTMVDIRFCEIPLKPLKLPKLTKPMKEQEKEKFWRHIKFLDLRLYVDKGPFGYNWLMFSITLGKIPKNNPAIIKCKLYVIGQSDKKYLLAEQKFDFDKSTEVSFTTSFSKEKICKRYLRISEPVITWRELTDENKDLMRKRQVSSLSDKTIVRHEEKDLFFRFELKLSDGEHDYEMRRDEFQAEEFVGDYNIFKDLEVVLKDEKFSNILVTSGDRCIKVNKAILAARSEVLGAILREKPNLKSLPINIQPDNLQHFIHYLYTGQIHKFTAKELDDLLSAATEYKMECLINILSLPAEELLLKSLLEAEYIID